MDEALQSAVQRRLDRLRFDLHDGPQQDVHLLAVDLNLFREQLEPVLAGHPDAAKVLGRVDDLTARLGSLDQALRRLASSVESPFRHEGSLREALQAVVQPFSARTGIEPRLEFGGDLGRVTESQRMTLLALIREALSNVRAHSQATAVAITLSVDDDGVGATVTDDGQGFDPATTEPRAARDGHLGLVGMRERARMLGGETTIDSRPGGPTRVTVWLPAWPE